MNSRIRPTTLLLYKECLSRVLVHIQHHLDEPLALDELAHLACPSPYHFHHVFSGMTGETLAGHIRRLRLERAATRLKLSANPVHPLTEVAVSPDLTAFFALIKGIFGLL